MDHLLSKEYFRDEFISMNSTGHFVVVPDILSGISQAIDLYF
jgi:hypothetical protein